MKRIAVVLLVLSGVSCGLVEDRRFTAESELAQIAVYSNVDGARVFLPCLRPSWQ